jgi:hypothetical protein
MFALLAAICFAIGALESFTSLSGLDKWGLLFLGLFFLALAGVVPIALPWKRQA